MKIHSKSGFIETVTYLKKNYNVSVLVYSNIFSSNCGSGRVAEWQFGKRMTSGSSGSGSVQHAAAVEPAPPVAATVTAFPTATATAANCHCRSGCGSRVALNLWLCARRPLARSHRFRVPSRVTASATRPVGCR
jgi:hypothetical protein